MPGIQNAAVAYWSVEHAPSVGDAIFHDRTLLVVKPAAAGCPVSMMAAASERPLPGHPPTTFGLYCPPMRDQVAGHVHRRARSKDFPDSLVRQRPGGPEVRGCDDHHYPTHRGADTGQCFHHVGRCKWVGLQATQLPVQHHAEEPGIGQPRPTKRSGNWRASSISSAIPRISGSRESAEAIRASRWLSFIYRRIPG